MRKFEQEYDITSSTQLVRSERAFRRDIDLRIDKLEQRDSVIDKAAREVVDRTVRLVELEVAQLVADLAELRDDVPAAIESANQQVTTFVATADQQVDDFVAAAQVQVEEVLSGGIDDGSFDGEARPARIKLLRSAVPGQVPTVLASGQIAINEVDSKLFWRNADGSVGSLDLTVALYATQAWVIERISELIGVAPGLLNTLAELAAALGGDANFSATVTGLIGQKLNSSAYTAGDVLSKLLTVDGAASGLDADLLDGIHAATFARRDQANTFAGTQTVQGDIATYRTASPTTGVVYLGQDGSRYLFYDGSNYNLPGAPLYVQGGLVWHAGNDGVNSGLDADKVRGATPGAFGLARLGDADWSAARSGIGLPIYAVTIADWNVARTNGWFMGSNVANAPSTNWYIGQVVAHNDIWVTQTVWDFTAGVAVPTYRRWYLNGTWSSWITLPAMIATTAQAQAGADDITAMTPLKTAQAIAALAPVKLVSSAYAEMTTWGNYTAVIPADNTIPQVTEGTQLFSLQATVAAGDRVRITGCLLVSAGADNIAVSAAVFRNGAANAIAAMAHRFGFANMMETFPFDFEDEPGAGTHTYTLRVGPSTGNGFSINSWPGYWAFGGIGRTNFALKVIRP